MLHHRLLCFVVLLILCGDGRGYRQLVTPYKTRDLGTNLRLLKWKSSPLAKPRTSYHSKSVNFQHSALRRSFDELVYNPPSYMIDTLKRDSKTRWTPRDIVARSGVDLVTVERDLMAMAVLTGAQLEVTEEGEILYTFPTNLEQVLRERSSRRRLEEFYQRVSPYVSKVYRISFGIMLLTSLVLVYTAYVAAMSSSTSEDEKKKERRNNARRHTPSIHVHVNLFDLWYIFERPRYFERIQRRETMSFAEAVYSFLFGDGDPNEHFDTQLYQRAAQYIQRQQGFVTAEELAVFSRNVPALPANSNSAALSPNDPLSSSTMSESFVLPFLLRFNGRPCLVEDQIIYHFPDLIAQQNAMNSVLFSQQNNYNGVPLSNPSTPSRNPFVHAFNRYQKPSSSSLAPKLSADDVLFETSAPFTMASAQQVSLAILLGGANAVGVAWLGGFLRANGPSIARMSRSSTSVAFWPWMRSVYPLLAVYAMAYVLTPTIRYLRHQRETAAIATRNEQRNSWWQALQAPSPTLAEKMQARKKLQEVAATAAAVAKERASSSATQATKEKQNGSSNDIFFDSSKSNVFD